jgi:hypothetical protein
VRTDKYKLIQYHGIWDREELYDMINDPTEMKNLAEDSEFLQIKIDLRKRIYILSGNTDGEHVVPYTERKHAGNRFRDMTATTASDFPKEWLRTGEEADRFEADFDDSVEKWDRIRREQAEIDAKKNEE